MNPVFERAKTFHALDRGATVIGLIKSVPLHITLLTGGVRFYSNDLLTVHHLTLPQTNEHRVMACN
jgi:hypothetical protein